MKATIEKPETWKRTINIEIPQEDFQKNFSEKVRSYRQKIKLPGFRPGKVPADMIRVRFGQEIKAEVLGDFVQSCYRDACTEHSISPISQGVVNNISAEDGQPVSFAIETQIDPPVDIKGYDKLKIKMTPRKIKDSDVNEALENLRERMAEFKDIDRPAKKGDHVMIEYERVVIDGEERGDFSNPTYPVEVGAGKNKLLKEFDKGFIGTSAGETTSVTVRFPRDYNVENLAGKEGVFDIKVTKVQEKVLPAVDETFIKRMGNFSDEEALRNGLRDDLERREQERARNEAYGKAIDQLIKTNPFDVPPARLQAYYQNVIEEAGRQARPGQPQPTIEEVEQRYHDVAVNAIKRFRIIQDIAQKEKIKPTQEEVDAEIGRMAEMYQQPFDDLKQALRRNGTTNRIRMDLTERKTLDFLIGGQSAA